MSAGAAWPDRAGTVRVEPGDTSFWQGLWKTDAFRGLLEDPRTGYAQVVDWASTRPWWWVVGEQGYERRHFGAWFGQAIVARDYDNAFITDLFHWHDVLHARTLALGPFPSQLAWRSAMRANEIAVSMETETLLYWRHPGARAGSFSFPIWVDELGPPLRPDQLERLRRFRVLAREDTAFGRRERTLRAALSASGAWPLPHLEDPACDRLGWEGLWELRRATTHWPDAGNPVEQALADYEAQSEPFYDGWAGHWREVETERVVFETLCAQGQWRRAVARREAIWRERADANGVPYGDIASTLANAS